MDKLESTLIQECMEKNEARVFKNIFPDIFSVEEFNKLLNLRSFQTTQRLIPTKEVRKLTKWKNLSDQDRREPWVKDTTTEIITLTITADDGTVTTMSVPIGDFQF